MKKFLEELAKLEHEQWIEWSKSIAKSEEISKERLERWKKYWVPYEELPEEVKEEDRKYARKVLTLIKERIEKLLREIDKIDGITLEELGIINKEMGIDEAIVCAMDYVKYLIKETFRDTEQIKHHNLSKDA